MRPDWFLPVGFFFFSTVKIVAEKRNSHNHACVVLCDKTGLYKGQKYYQSKTSVTDAVMQLFFH